MPHNVWHSVRLHLLLLLALAAAQPATAGSGVREDRKPLCRALARHKLRLHQQWHPSAQSHEQCTRNCHALAMASRTNPLPRELCENESKRLAALFPSSAMHSTGRSTSICQMPKATRTL